MRTVGIIAEYNPFHDGHLYQLREIRGRYGAEYIIIAMSGDFVQRGEPAIYDKYIRTEIALRAGADLVLELPVCFATAGAEDFAAAGVALLDRLGMVDGLCFGSEAGDLTPLIQAADVLLTEPLSFKKILKERLKSGDSYPKAQAQALIQVLTSDMAAKNAGQKDAGSDTAAKWPITPDKLYSSPNNILGIEYLKALRRRGSAVTPLTIRRSGQDYHDTRLSTEKGFPSASALRQAIASGEIDYFRDMLCSHFAGSGDGLPFSVFAGDAGSSLNPAPLFPDDLTAVLNAKLLALSGDPVAVSGFPDFSPELASRLSRQTLDFASFRGRVEQLKTRSCTYARISRALLHLILGITGDLTALAKAMDYVPYVRILGFRRSSAPLLTDLRRACRLPLITKTADARNYLDTDGMKIFEKDLFASHLYQSLVFAKSGVRLPNEYTRSLILV